MRIHYYSFPENTPEKTLLENGCAIVLKSEEEIYAETIPDEHRNEVEYIDRTIAAISLKKAKELMKKYGGAAWTEHYDRSGTFFEATPIKLSGNNSKVKYNKHL